MKSISLYCQILPFGKTVEETPEEWGNGIMAASIPPGSKATIENTTVFTYTWDESLLTYEPVYYINDGILIIVQLQIC